MTKGQTPAPKLKGATCHISADVINTCNTLPRTPGSNGLVIVKFKRKLEYRGHVFFLPCPTKFYVQVVTISENERPAVLGFIKYSRIPYSR